MKIKSKDILTVSFSTDHPCSSYGQPVMLVESATNSVISHESWLLCGYKVVDATQEELETFKKWYKLIEAMQR